VICYSIFVGFLVLATILPLFLSDGENGYMK